MSKYGKCKCAGKKKRSGRKHKKVKVDFMARVPGTNRRQRVKFTAKAK